MFYSKNAFLDVAYQIPVPSPPTQVLEAVNFVQAPPILLIISVAANVPVPGDVPVAALAVPAPVLAPPVTGQGGNNVPDNSLA